MELHQPDTDSSIFYFKTINTLIADLKHFQEEFNFSDLDPAQELYSKNNKNDVGKVELETAPDLDLGESILSGCKPYSISIKQNS